MKLRRKWHKKDQRAVLRSKIEILGKIGNHKDYKTFQQACLIYEFMPPYYLKSVDLLRRKALVALYKNSFDKISFFAAKLLNNPYASKMSGKPAKKQPLKF